jgi:acyl-CoA reductase-like NAD-dependent aldehyde dehydrogenase
MQVPMTMSRVAQLLAQAGVPPGVFQIINGTTDSVTSLIDHADVAAITFVGSSKVAEIVAKRARALNKRVRTTGDGSHHVRTIPDSPCLNAFVCYGCTSVCRWAVPRTTW